MDNSTVPCNPVLIEHLYAIGQIVTQASDWKPALDEIVKKVRSLLIFDNLVMYRGSPEIAEAMDIVYARAIGRGRSAEADNTWGESIAAEVIERGKTILREAPPAPDLNRLQRPFILGIPLKIRQKILGSLIFIRFGGPAFLPEQVRLAEFIGQQLSLIVERHNLQSENAQLLAQQRQARLQEDFVSTISHELRNPLGFIKGYTTTLLRADATWDVSTQTEFLTIIDQETDHLLELIENLLDSARIQSGQLPMKFQPIRLDALLNDAIMRATVRCPDQVIILEIPENIAPVRGDPHRLAQVFENLLTNAAKYAPDSPVTITINVQENGTEINVCDSGPGIAEEHLPRLFQRFYRVPDQTNARGTGLGLFICQQIIQAHHGQINATSTLGKGTTFHIFLPNQYLT